MPVSTQAAQAARWWSLRLRQTAHLRDLCAETSFTTAHLVQPIFIVEGLRASEAIPGLDGNFRLSIDGALDVITADVAAGVRHFLLFALPTSPAPYGAFAARPSDMMDGRTARLRGELDDRGHGAVPIMSYSTRFASRFCGPFRTAAGSAPTHGTRQHYQVSGEYAGWCALGRDGLAAAREVDAP